MPLSLVSCFMFHYQTVVNSHFKMHNPLKKLSRSISHKLLGKRSNDNQSTESFSSASSTTSSTATTPQQSSMDEDPYREILRSYEDNVSHLVYHGSSLRSMTSLDIRKKSDELNILLFSSSYCIHPRHNNLFFVHTLRFPLSFWMVPVD
ncbi:hypothetical protein L3Y34_017811 [Caenorhabditis briggsae]|uniref:Uncharacterized protein n=1 Tax=Caenorhabditis briggsae TaxID=6238 RepID=A0AAE9DJH0_CAEBR|nr:hypothetical protein L3Y34_017811 [Caenorhabditis briggsae]